MSSLMSRSIRRTVYFERPGEGNTDETLRLARERAEELGIRNVVVASSSGETGVAASRVFSGYNLVVVTSVVGYLKPNEVRMRPDYRSIVEENGGKVIHAAHAFGALGRAVHSKFGAVQIDEIVANVLRLFSEGVKVACEIACMAVDAGYFRIDEEAIAIGGEGSGADTAIVLQPSNTHTFFETKIREIICKPR
jgi:hypothetical protein